MDELRVGQTAKVLELKSNNSTFIKRITDLGLIVGSTIECVIRRGGSSCYRICGALIAVRHENVSNILVDIVE